MSCDDDDIYTICEGGLYCAEGVLKTIADQAGIKSDLIPAMPLVYVAVWHVPVVPTARLPAGYWH